ncbi:MarR family transcriptional regulator [Streptomyces sp. NPDC057438]|uniref:MarR family transcriptional regulator n=1 Tax=Streptomyces sp. NPDC057438 TaxID=3346133 RepID=UPI00367E843D
MSIPDLVEALGLASSTLNRQTAALLKNGLVERTVDPSGSIVHKFRITEEGIGRLRAERDERHPAWTRPSVPGRRSASTASSAIWSSSTPTSSG